MLELMTEHLSWRKAMPLADMEPGLALRTQEFLHASLSQDIGMQDIAQAIDTDRFRLTRQFKKAFGIPPHAYLIQLRLVEARRLLKLGMQPAEVATELCFADQSHLGRWFKRAYRLTPTAYQRSCTKLPD